MREDSYSQILFFPQGSSDSMLQIWEPCCKKHILNCNITGQVDLLKKEVKQSGKNFVYICWILRVVTEEESADSRKS